MSYDCSSDSQCSDTSRSEILVLDETKSIIACETSVIESRNRLDTTIEEIKAGTKNNNIKKN